jgi:hypothetical protein
MRWACNLDDIEVEYVTYQSNGLRGGALTRRPPQRDPRRCRDRACPNFTPPPGYDWCHQVVLPPAPA